MLGCLISFLEINNEITHFHICSVVNKLLFGAYHKALVRLISLEISLYLRLNSTSFDGHL